MLVPFQTPAMPLETFISLLKMKLQSSDSYHPSERGDHSNRWTRIGDGSIPLTSVLRIVCSAEAVSMVESMGITGESWEMRVRMVCKGRCGSQLSSYQSSAMFSQVHVHPYPFCSGRKLSVCEHCSRGQTAQASRAVLPRKSRCSDGHLPPGLF